MNPPSFFGESASARCRDFSARWSEGFRFDPCVIILFHQAFSASSTRFVSKRRFQPRDCPLATANWRERIACEMVSGLILGAVLLTFRGTLCYTRGRLAIPSGAA